MLRPASHCTLQLHFDVLCSAMRMIWCGTVDIIKGYVLLVLRL